MPKRSRPYEIGLSERLKEGEHAINYLNAALLDSDETFLLALKDVVEARLGMSKLVEKTGIEGVHLKRIFSGEGNPRLSMLVAVLSALDLNLNVNPIRFEQKRRA